jgi:hypothetical protein
MSIATYASKTDFAQPATDVEQNSIISNQLTHNTRLHRK